jgi:hypothetical protein
VNRGAIQPGADDLWDVVAAVPDVPAASGRTRPHVGAGQTAVPQRSIKFVRFPRLDPSAVEGGAAVGSGGVVTGEFGPIRKQAVHSAVMFAARMTRLNSS